MKRSTPLTTAKPLTKSKPLVVAHRGASAAAKENTIEAFELAVAMGADMVELDVRQTADGVLVVHHDPHVDSVGDVCAVTHQQLPPYVPTLEAALAACGPLRVNVEIKNDPDEPGFDAELRIVDATAELLLALEAERFIVSSFHRPSVDRIRERYASLDSGLLVGMTLSLSKHLHYCQKNNHMAIHPYHPALSRDFVAEARRGGIAVNTWTVDDPRRIRTLAQWEVSAVITNVPDVARSVIADL
jgi:glycerophosphoryl diester phosphodiesterase